MPDISARRDPAADIRPPVQTLNLEKIRGDFPVLRPGEVFLDSVASSLTPTPVIDAMAAYYTRYRANVHRGTYDLSMQASEFFERAAANVAAFVNASPEEIVFTQNTTSAINQVALTLSFKPGDEIIVSSVEHTSNLLPWIRLTSRSGVKLRCYNPGREGRFDADQFSRLFNERTRLVALTYVSNALGSVFPVQEISRLCKARNVLYLIDAAQAAPHMKIDVRVIAPDFLAFSGHKMLGPTGVGVLYIAKSHAEELVPAFLGGGSLMSGGCGCASVDSCNLNVLTFNHLPHKWQAGTPPIAEVLGLSRAIDYLEEIGFEHLEHHVRTLTNTVVEGLKSIKGVELFGPTGRDERSAIVSFNIDGMAPDEVGRALNDKYRIAVRTGDHCALAYFKDVQRGGSVWGNVRASFYIYNTMDDALRLLTAVEELASARR